MFKNILISGCAIFPLKQTCINKIFYFNESLTNIASDEPEAWAKVTPIKMNYKEYNSSFTGLKHDKKVILRIIEKIVPFLILLLLFYQKFLINPFIKF